VALSLATESPRSDSPEKVVLPAGVFTMGSPGYESRRIDKEGPQCLVTIASAFAVGRFEVTCGQFAAFVAETSYPSQGVNSLATRPGLRG